MPGCGLGCVPALCCLSGEKCGEAEGVGIRRRPKAGERMLFGDCMGEVRMTFFGGSDLLLGRVWYIYLKGGNK